MSVVHSIINGEEDLIMDSTEPAVAMKVAA